MVKYIAGKNRFVKALSYGVKYALKRQFTFAFSVQQPLSEPHVSGTKHKAGSMLNLIRWVSARILKENLNPPKGYRYPFEG